MFSFPFFLCFSYIFFFWYEGVTMTGQAGRPGCATVYRNSYRRCHGPSGRMQRGRNTRSHTHLISHLVAHAFLGMRHDDHQCL